MDFSTRQAVELLHRFRACEVRLGLSGDGDRARASLAYLPFASRRDFGSQFSAPNSAIMS